MIRAASLLGAHRTPRLDELLAPIRPEEMTVRFMPRWFDRLGPRWVGAVTMPWAIYIRPTVLVGDDDRIGRLIAHELVHCRQWRTLGVIGFLRRYVADYLRGRIAGLDHRRAYLAIALEREAAEIARRL